MSDWERDKEKGKLREKERYIWRERERKEENRK